MKELKIGCGKPTGSKVGEAEKEEKPMEKSENKKEDIMASVSVGTKAPDPGDFTFV